ncbi:unnamed protein product [Acanthosepion pharaonis]|uniref:Reverse transcriptase domain-containing protein n=1 Tax=Acanthosepion pharaonis TaxID=158019 RepID=A0A812AUG3_ACAPH|nr:unnamed protein product [Sepia pharaonis]
MYSPSGCIVSSMWSVSLRPPLPIGASLRCTLEQRWAYQQPTVLCFVDFAAAFDSVDSVSLWRMMEADGLPAKLLRLSKGYYRSMRARVRAYGEEFETFEVKIDVRQRCTLSPTLFNYTIDYILGKSLRDYAGVAVVIGLFLRHSQCSNIDMSLFTIAVCPQPMAN